MLELRDYQEKAVQALLRSNDQGRLVVCPTGVGKSLILASFLSRSLPKRSVVLQHRKELIQQNHQKLSIFANQKIGLYSAGLSKKEIKPITVAGIQSIYKLGSELDVDIAVIDECHLVSPNEDTMYHKFLSDLKARNPGLVIAGLTATAFRMTTGSLIDGDGFFNKIVYDVDMLTLIKQGYLSPLLSKASKEAYDTSGLRITRGEFDTSEAESLFGNKKRFDDVYKELSLFASDRKSVLIFCSGVYHAESLTHFLREKDEVAECLTGNSSGLFREQIINDFKAGRIKYLLNCDILTTGFDAPNVDCIVILRATQSPGLFVQMVGRGMRVSEGKENCLVLDFGGNIERHGPINKIFLRRKARKINGKTVVVNEVNKEKTKVCWNCREVVSYYVIECPVCQASLKRIEHDERASEKEILSEVDYEDYDVLDVAYSLHSKKGKPASFRIDLRIGFNLFVSDFFAFNHGGRARHLANNKWRYWAKCQGLPSDSEMALEVAMAGALKEPARVRVVQEGKYNRIQKINWK